MRATELARSRRFSDWQLTAFLENQTSIMLAFCEIGLAAAMTLAA